MYDPLFSESEVESLITTVAESFGGSLEEWLDSFADPMVIATPESALALDRDAAWTMADQVRSQLRDQGFDRTELRRTDIAMIGDDLAFADCSS